MLWTQRKKMRNKEKCNACKGISIDWEVARQVSSIIDVDRCSCRGTNQQKAKRSRSIHQVSRSYQGDMSFLNRSTRCWEAIEIAIRKSLRSSTDSNVSRRCRAFQNSFSKKEKNTNMNAIQHTTQPMIQSTQKSLKIVSQSKTKLSTRISKTHTHKTSLTNFIFQK